jgi:hypothetical protein
MLLNLRPLSIDLLPSISTSLKQVLLVAPPPFVFEAAWEVIRPQIGRHADIVRFVTVEELRRGYFTPATLPTEFR